MMTCTFVSGRAQWVRRGIVFWYAEEINANDRK